MKKTFMKSFAALLALCMLLLTLTGCHGTEGMAEYTVPSEFDSEKPIEITFWAKNDTNKTQVSVYNNAIKGFEEKYPNVKIKIRLYTDYTKIYNDVITNIATGTTPNICITYPDHIATYLTGQNTVAELDNLMNDEKFGFGGSEVRFDSLKKGEVVEKFLDECRFGGYYYALPFMRSTEALYINKTYVEKLGYTIPDVITWDWIWEVSEAATAKDADGIYAINGQSVMIPFIYKSTDNMMIQMLAQMGSGYSTDDGQILLFNDDAKQILYDVSKHVKTGAFSTFKISSYPGNFLNAGQCIFAIDSTAGATWMGSNAPLMDISKENVVDFETVVRPVPQYNVNDMQMMSQGPSICIFNKPDAQEVLASWLFMQYLLTDDIQVGYAKTEGYVPVTTKAQNSAEYLDYLSRSGEDNNLYYDIKIDAAKLLLEHTDETFVTPVFNGSASLRNAAGQLIENVARSTRRSETIDEAYMSKLYDDVKSLYRLDSPGEHQTNGAGSAEKGPLPKESRALLITLAVVWVLLGIYAAKEFFKNKRQ